MISTNEQTAPNACDFCRRRKRSCNRSMPACSSCVRQGIVCIYPHISADVQSSANADLGTNSRKELMALYFQDQQTFRLRHLSLPNPSFSVPRSSLVDLGPPEILVEQYLQRLFWWIPIISPILVSERIDNPDATFLVLLWAVKVLLWKPSGNPSQDPKTNEYLFAKQMISDSVTSNILSFSILQAQVLLAVFELGHAIYPAAFLSVGACMRYSIALGMEKFVQSESQDELLSMKPEEVEERRRTWWFISILEQFIQLGAMRAPFSIQGPASDSILPADDVSFEQGKPPNRFFRVSDTAHVEMGSLARMCQSSYLLGLVDRFNRDRSSAGGWSGEQQEKYLQLERTISSLLTLSVVEGEIRRMQVCGQTSICYSALIALHDPDGLRADAKFHELVTDMLKPVADALAEGSSILLSGRLVSIDDASPLLLFGAYQVAAIYHRLLPKYGLEVSHPLSLMKTKLEVMSKRWLAGGIYLQMLDESLWTADVEGTATKP